MEIISLSELIHRLRIFNNTNGKANGDAVYSEKEFHRILARERYRSTRSGCSFSVACFQLNRRNGQTSAKSFIAYLKGRIRSTDEMGWFDASSVGVLLYNTAREGASSFAKKVKTAAVSQNSLAKYSIYTYPSEWFDIRHDMSDQEISQPPLALPLWKRGLDLFVVSIGLIILSPFFLFLAIIIKIISPGPVFFKQTRVGKGGRLFQLYKFRSMCIDADAQLEKLRKFSEVNGPIFKMAQDPRITRVGRWLRRGSLDEFPQFINVLKGEMSVVGPRPPIPDEVTKYEEWQKRRLDINQGITGLWQISGRSKLSFEEMVLLDIIYMENWSLWWDMAIILKTIPTVLKAEGAY